MELHRATHTYTCMQHMFVTHTLMSRLGTAHKTSESEEGLGWDHAGFLVLLLYYSCMLLLEESGWRVYRTSIFGTCCEFIIISK